MTSSADKDAPNLSDSHSALPLPPAAASHRSTESQVDTASAPESLNNTVNQTNTTESQQSHDSAIDLQTEQKSKKAQSPNEDSSEIMASLSDNPLPHITKNEDYDTDSSVLGQNLKRRLMDIESSFIPDGAAALPTMNANSNQSASKLIGADDTFLFGGSPGRAAHLAKTSPPDEGDVVRESSVMLPSSPAAAAMQRGLNKGNGKIGGLGVSLGKISVDSREDDENVAPTLKKRPDFLQNRQSSQRSSVSSIIARSDISGGTDNTVGADYALQSGGAAPVLGSNAINSKSSSTLSRLSSLGSITSLTSSNGAQGDSNPELVRTRSSMSTSGGLAVDTGLTRLEEEDSQIPTSQPETPRATSFGVAGIAPSDTVIAQHVQNIRVPETIAREYRAKHSGTRSPERRLTIGMSYSTRSKHNLTLKEQNNKIDKLSKENFDLKLKIHFLDQALQNRSDEGFKEMISKNVQLQTDLANEKKENQGLRRKIRELERKVKAQEDSKFEKVTEDEGVSDLKEEKAELEEEIIYLRETLQQTEMEVERLREENMSKEVEKRRLGDYVRTMGDQRLSAETSPRPDVEEINEMWKDLLQAETARRETADEDSARLRDENKKLKGDLLLQQQSNGAVAAAAAARVTDSRASTLVDQLKNENAELRRDLSAQTSMLTSRNRERERLQLEIEDLKLQSRRGGLEVGLGARSIAGDSIFDRSVSRAAQHQRSSSRASGMTRVTTAAELRSAIASGADGMQGSGEREREELERTLDSLRDELARVKMLNQDLESALNEHLDGLEALEQENRQLRDEGTLALEDLQAMQTERDELLASVETKEADFADLRAQAVEEIDKLEDELEQKKGDFEALRDEFKGVSENVVRLEDELAASRRKEESLESQIEELEKEVDGLEEKTQDLTAKNERLDVQLENSQNEVAFLREEQEGDKIKIGELEASLAAAQTKVEDMLAQAKEERRQRDALDSQEKADIQKLLDEINSDNIGAKDEIRRLKKKLADKEREAETWRERLETLESNLREALGDLNGTRSSILKDVTKLQRDLEHTLSALEISRQDLAEKDRLLRTRDSLLESSGLESKKLSDLLDKERSARRSDRAAWELMQRSQQSLTRTIQQSDSRVTEIETARQSEKRKFSSLEKKLREQLSERNTLLFTVWNNLSSLCGPDFVTKHPFPSKSGASSTEAMEKNFTAFSKDVNAAIKAIESMFGSFKSQIRELERTMWKEVQNIERALELRTKRVDHLEKMLGNTTKRAAVEEREPIRATSSRGSSKDEQYTRLKNENKILRAEVQVLRNATTGAVPERSSSSRSRASTLMRAYSGSIHEDGQVQHVAVDPTVTVPSLPPPESPQRNASPTSLGRDTNRRASHHAGMNYHSRQTSADVMHAGLVPSQHGQTNSEQRWVHRLKELERRLKAEREARLLDRSGARKRIEESEAERERLRQRLEHELEMRASMEIGHGAGEEGSVRESFED